MRPLSNLNQPLRHLFRRAAVRFVPSATPSIPPRSRPSVARNLPRSALTPRWTQLQAQRRWNSSEVSRQSAGADESEPGPNDKEGEENASVSTDGELKDGELHGSAPDQAESSISASTESASDDAASTQTESASENPDLSAADEKFALANDAADHPAEAAAEQPLAAEQKDGDAQTANAVSHTAEADAAMRDQEWSEGMPVSTGHSPQDAPYQKRHNTGNYTAGKPKQTLFVGNIAYYMTAGELKEHMEQFGTVQRVAIITDRRGFSKGFAYCQYDSTATATHAKEALDGTIFDNRELAVNFAGYNIEGRTFASPPSRTLYVGNLPFDLSHQELHGLFKDIPNVYDIRVSVDRNTGLLRGFVHAEFLDVESARMAFELLNAKSVYGRTLRLDYSKSIRQLQPNWRNRSAS